MYETVLGTSEETRLAMAYGRCVPVFKYGERTSLDGWAKMYEILERRPAVCLRDAGTRRSAEVLASDARRQLDPDKYIVRIAQGTQIMVHRRADYEGVIIPEQREIRARVAAQYPHTEWCRLADAAERLGYTRSTARVVLWRENVERHPIDRSGTLVYRKAEVEAIATRPWDPGPFYRPEPKRRIPLDWYPDDPRTTPRKYTPPPRDKPRWMRMTETAKETS